MIQRRHDHNFGASGVSDATPVELALLAQADAQVGDPDVWLIIDNTALPKKGRNSVGVALQHAGSLGKNANCQMLVSLHWLEMKRPSDERSAEPIPPWKRKTVTSPAVSSDSALVLS